jgi:sugar lactone lactonase YvrE
MRLWAMAQLLDYSLGRIQLRCVVWLLFISGPPCNVVAESDLLRHQLGWGWDDRPHGQTLASDVLGQFADGNPAMPSFGSYGPYGGPKPHAFFFFAFNAGRYQVVGSPAAHQGIGKLAVPDYWNHRVLIFDLREDGSLAARRASALIGQERFDVMEIGHGPNRFQFPSSCAFDPDGKFLFVADEYNHRVLQFDMDDPRQAVRVYGQPNFDTWGIDASPGELIWDSTREDVRGPKLVRKPSARGLFLPRGVASDGRRLFVADCDNHRVLVFDQRGDDNGPEAIAVLGQADFSGYHPNRGGKPDAHTMCFPAGLAVDPSNRYLLVADSLNFRWLVFDVSKPIENGMPAIAAVTLPGIEPRDLPNPPFERTIAGATAVAVSQKGDVYVADRPGLRVAVYRLEEVLAGKHEPRAAIGRYEMSTDLWQMKPGYGGPTGLAVSGDHLYVAEPRGNRVLCFDAKNPEHRSVDLLGQFYGNDLSRPHYNKYGPNNGPDPYGFDFADGVPALSVTDDGHWLLVSDAIGGRVLFFPLGEDGLALDRSARLAVGVPTLDARANSYGAARFNRPGHTLLAPEGRLFAADFQGSRILYFELPNLMNTTGRGALDPLRPFKPSSDRPPYPREDFEFRSVDSGGTALHVLGQVDFYTGLRDTASPRQMGKEISGLAYDRERGWLFVCEKLNHRVLIVDVSRGVETYMPAMAVLGQPDFDKNAPQWGQNEWHPRGMTQPAGVCYDHATKTLFVVNGDQEREILGFDLSGEIANGMAPVLRIGGPRATVESDLPIVERWLALDEKNRRLWSGLFGLDLSGDHRKRVPLIGWFGLGNHPEAARDQDTHTGNVPSLLGYSVGFCYRFGGAVNALAVNPRTGTIYTADSPRYRVLCFQPDFRFRPSPIELRENAPACEIIGTGGLAPLRFSLNAGQLPEGLKLDAETGLIRGTTPAKRGSYDVEISVQTATGTTRGKLQIVIKSDE